MPELMGERLDRFELIAELASGGMASVFLARLGGAGGFQRLYAIKRLHEHLAKNGEFIEMFLDEARLAARIHHPNVVPILEIGTTAAGHYLVMEYIEGDTEAYLFHRAAHEGKQISARVAVRIALDALAGLHAAHELGDDDGNALEIVHRDVSPHNVLVGIDGVARITDFGIARAASRLASTRHGQLKGKVAYMAPEQARSEKVDRRADVFALGICLWEMLAMQRLFKSDSEVETLNRVLYEPIPSVTSVAPTIAPELDAVCMRALTRDPEKRFATAAEFAAALESAAKALDLVGTHREVAACLEQIVGGSLSDRRATLRAWLADGERQRELPSWGRDTGSNPASYPRGPVSASVSSTMAQIPAPPSSGTLGAHAAGSGRSSAKTWRAAAKLGLVVFVAGTAAVLAAIQWWPAGPENAEAVEATTRTVPVTPSASPSAGTSPPGPSASATAEPAPQATSGQSAADRPIAPPKTAPSAPASGRPAKPATSDAPPASSVPDDMRVNPYR